MRPFCFFLFSGQWIQNVDLEYLGPLCCGSRLSSHTAKLTVSGTLQSLPRDLDGGIYGRFRRHS